MTATGAPHGEQQDEPVVRTSPKRMAQGIAIVAITLGVGAAILLPFFNDMASTPPPVTQIRTTPERPPAGEQPPPPAAAGTTTIAILSGSSVQGNPDYDPDEAQVPAGNIIVWDNQDTVPHTATSGTGPEDPDSGSMFDTGIIDGGAQSDPIEIEGAAEGDSFDYYCAVHPYMKGRLTITAAASSAPEGAQEEGGGAAAPSGTTLTILQGSSVQGNPDYNPDPLEVKQGETVSITNEDNVPHTVTSGKGPEDQSSGQLFDSGILDSGGTYELDTSSLDPGEYDYFCMVHPYMTGKLNVIT